MEESDFWGREYLHVDLYGITMGVDYYDLKKIVFVKFKVAQTLQEFDLHESNKTIFDKSGGINMEEAIKANNPSKIEGTLLVHENDRSGELPSDYRIINNIGDTITISSFIYDDHVALNGKKAIVYYTNDTNYIATSITSNDSGNYTLEDNNIEPADNSTIEIQNTSRFKSF